MRELIRLDSILTDDGEVRRCERLAKRRDLLRRLRPCGRPAPFLLEPTAAYPLGTYLCEEHARAYDELHPSRGRGETAGGRVVVSFTLSDGSRWNWPVEGDDGVAALVEILDRANIPWVCRAA